MFCSACGTKNDDGDLYCRSCGSPLRMAVAPGAPGGTYVAPQPVEGAVGAAWRDISGTPGWIKKMVLLCLLGCIPVLNFGVEGYALRWSRDLSMGTRDFMPKQVFRKKEILTGFRACIMEIIYGSAYFLVALLAWLLITAFFGLFGAAAAGIMGTLGAVLLIFGYALFFYPLQNAAIMRMVTVDYLEGGLNIGKIWQAYKRSIGGIMGASLLPVIIVGLIQGIVYAVFMAIIAAMSSGIPGLVENMYYDYGYGYGMDSLNGLFSLGAGAMFLLFVMGLILAMLSVFSEVFCWRAVGHWSVRNAPEWAEESDEAAVADQIAQATQRQPESTPAPASAPAPAPDEDAGYF